MFVTIDNINYNIRSNIREESILGIFIKDQFITEVYKESL